MAVFLKVVFVEVAGTDHMTTHSFFDRISIVKYFCLLLIYFSLNSFHSKKHGVFRRQNCPSRQETAHNAGDLLISDWGKTPETMPISLRKVHTCLANVLEVCPRAHSFVFLLVLWD